MIGALEIRAAHGFPHRDSAIIGAARELYTENMSHGREIEGVALINPFR